MKNSIPKKQFAVLSELYSYYNKKLFLGELPACMVSLVHSREFHGAFVPEIWQETKGEKSLIHEIMLNADTMTRKDIDWHSTLVHEMAHLHIQVFGKVRSRGYHCIRWASLMKQIGLQPSHTGKPGGKTTGRSMTHYIIEGGAFEKAFRKIDAKDIAKYNVPYKSLFSFRNSSTPVSTIDNGGSMPARSSTSKISYACNCGNKVWGRRNLHLLCAYCNSVFQVISKQSK